MMKFTATEVEAIKWLKRDISILVTRIPEKTEKDGLGFITPGMSVFKKLIKQGLCFQTIEDPMPDGIVFTESMELTEEGDAIDVSQY
jgi:hypothetical protein